MKPQLQFNSLLPLFQVIAIALVIVLVSIWLYRREERKPLIAIPLMVLRGLAVAAIALLILNPVLVQSAKAPNTRPALLVLVDTSHSMAVKDVEGATRLDSVKKQLLPSGDLTTTVGTVYTPTLYQFSSEANRAQAESFVRQAKPEGDRTCIGEAISKAIQASGVGAGAVLVLSDGRDNGEISPIEIARQAQSRGFPVFTVCVGKATSTKDVSVVMNRTQIFTALGQVSSIGADVTSSGFSSLPTKVDLLRDGKSVDTKTVFLSDTGHTDVSFSVKEDAAGTYRYTVAATPLTGEISTVNNKASALLTAGKMKTYVLLLEGRPSWDTKFLVQALRSDPNCSVDAFYKLTNDQYFAVLGSTEQTPAANNLPIPSTKTEFGKYDTIILGKGYEDFLTAKTAEELKQYVTEGGHLVFLRGKSANRLASLEEMEPVTWTDQEVKDLRVKITDEGSNNPAFVFSESPDAQTVVEKLPTLVSATRVAQEKALAVVLARAKGIENAEQPNREMAVLAYQRYGEGTVVSLIGQGLWKWALLPPDLQDYSTSYTDFWNQLMRWLVNQSDFLPGHNISVRTDHFAYSPGASVNLMVFVRGRKPASLPPVKIIGPDGKTSSVTLSAGAGKQADFLGAFRPKLPGDYIAAVPNEGKTGGQVTTSFSVYERRQEDMNTSADPALMSKIASSGGGKALALGDLKELPNLLRERELLLTKKVEPRSLWDRWPVLAFLLALLSVEWFVRRRHGLI